MSGNASTDIWIAGAFAAFSVDLLVYPLDTLKTRIQSPDYKRLFVDEGTNTVKKAALFRGLYQGLGSVIIATLPSSGAFFTTYESTKSFLNTHNPTSSGSNHPLIPKPIVHATASALAELVSCAILTPAEVIKQNAQMVSSPSSSSSSSSSSSPKDPKTRLTASATAQTLSRFRNNPLALWRGYTALAGRNLPFTAMQFPMFERLKEYLLERRLLRREAQRDQSGSNSSHQRNPKNDKQNWGDGRGSEKGQRQKSDKLEERMPLWESGAITAAAAGMAGAVAAVITTPIDVVKTRIMLAAGDEGTGDRREPNTQKESHDRKEDNSNKKQGKPRKSALTITRDILQEQGWKGLWRGGALRGAWTMLGSGLYLGVYESGRLYLERGREGGD